MEYLAFGPRIVASFLNLVGIEAQNADHAAGNGVGRVLHGFPALLNDAEPIVKGHDAGEYEGRVFAEAQARGGLT